MNILKRIQVYKQLRKEYSYPSNSTNLGLCYCLMHLNIYPDLEPLSELYSQCPKPYRDGESLYAWEVGLIEPRLEAIQNALEEARTLLFCYIILVGWVASCLVSLGLSL